MAVLPVTKKEGKRKGKKGIGPKMKNGHTKHKPNKAFINGGYSVTYHLKQTHTTHFFQGIKHLFSIWVQTQKTHFWYNSGSVFLLFHPFSAFSY